MQDQLLTCENCGNPFVYSVYEQTRDTDKLKNRSTDPLTNRQTDKPPLCPICTAIKASEQKHPPKPQKKTA